MIKRIAGILIVISFFSTSLFSNENANNEAEGRIEYFAKDTAIESSITSSTVENFISGSGGFNKSDNSPFCKALYKRYVKSDKNGNVTYSDEEKVDVSEVLVQDFDFLMGVYSCEYTIKGESRPFTVGAQFVNYRNQIDTHIREKGIKVFGYHDAEYSPDNIKNLEDGTIYEKNKNKGVFDYSVRQTAIDIGLMGVSSDSEKTTLSQFWINLITLNGDYVRGVAPNGDILLDEKIEKSLLVLNEKDGDEKAIETVKSIFAPLINTLFNTKLSEADKEVLLKKFSSFSYADFFDKKLFGLYYNFMNVAWGDLFAYASAVFLTFLTLYGFANVGYRYGMHELDNNPNKGSFDYPVKMRLVSVGMTMFLSFVPFPAGEGSVALPSGNASSSEVSEKIYAQTTIAKGFISYMGNIGTTIADKALGSTMVVYMEYLISASNKQSIKTALEISSGMKTNIVVQKIQSNFFQKHCVETFKTAYEKAGSFQAVSSSRWRNIEENWKSKNHKYFYDNGMGRVSVNLCAEIEKSIVFWDKALLLEKNGLSQTIESLEASGNNSATNTNLFTLTQLMATKNLGWLNVASLPIIHLYLKNTGLISLGETRKDIGSKMYGKSEITKATLGASKVYSEEAGNKQDAATLEEAGEIQLDDVAPEMLRHMMSKFVYFMLPSFDKLFFASKSLVSSSVKATVSILADFTPLGKGLKYASKVMVKMKPKPKKMSITDTKEALTGGTEQMASIVTAFLSVFLGFLLAVALYNLLLKVIITGIIALFIVTKIVMYLIDVFVYYFVSPFVVGWQMSISNNTNKLHQYISNGFVLLVIRPSLIVFSTMMFIISYEILESTFLLIFSVIYSNLEILNELIGGVAQEGLGGSLTGFLIMANIKGIGTIFVDFAGLILSYIMILKGDELILKKFGYNDESDSNIGSQINDKIQTHLAKV